MQRLEVDSNKIEDLISNTEYTDSAIAKLEQIEMTNSMSSDEGKAMQEIYIYRFSVLDYSPISALII